jgi:uncharacterized protein (DUF1810 family)
LVRSAAKDIHRGLQDSCGGRDHTPIRGLGCAETARQYAIRGLDEARAYLEHPVLGPRLVECAEAVLAVQGRSAREIFGAPDDLKLRSCATLFAEVSPAGSVFHRLIQVYFDGAADGCTLTLLGQTAYRA